MSLCQVPHTSLAPMLLLSYIWTSCSMPSWRISDSKYAILSCYTSLTSYTARAAPVFSVYNISSPWSSTTCSVSLQLAVPRTLMSRRDLHLLGDSSSVCSELLQILVWWRQNDICGCQFLTVEATFVGTCEDLTWLISFLCVLLSPHFYLPHC